MSKKQPKLTPWFCGDVKPARKGFYQRQYSQEYLTSHPDLWDGKRWIVYDVNGMASGPACQPNRAWRGLAVKP